MDFLLTNTGTADYSENATYHGHCRCCLEEGDHRDITKVYVDNGAKEIYADIFLDCFNVFLSTNTNLSTLICSDCVSRLRRARDFKALVMQTDAQLMDALQNCDNDQMVLVNVPVNKETLDTTIGFKIQVNDIDNTAKNPTEAITAEVINPESSSFEPDMETTIAPKQKTLKDIKKIHKKSLIMNTYQLLLLSNATLFKSKMRFGYPCFYCRQIFEDFELLKQHQNEQHEKTDLLKALKMCSADSLVVYADVKDLKCTRCDISMQNLNELKAHLIKIHQIKFHKNVSDRVIPFKHIEDSFECQICSFHFETFGSIEKHMNTHYRNYVCNICGSGFVTVLRLKTHMHTRHREGTFPCEFCVKVFNTQVKLKVHVDFVHRMLKKLKCYRCPERFSDYFVQKKHMVEVHGEKPVVYRCNVCGKGFRRRYTLSCHTKRHLDQKDIQCDVCPYTCYTNTELKEHKLKHDRLNFERTFKCSICDTLFMRRTSLKVHMRVHSDDNRYVCYICNKSFVHDHGLQVHMTNHHKYHSYNSDDLRHGCNWCEKSFEHSNNLRIHIQKYHSDNSGDVLK